MRGVDQKSVPAARKLRRNSTSAESRLWAELRNRQIDGFKFVRQEPIGSYVVDFVCREAKLIVEVDGATHSTDEELQRDAARSMVLECLGYKVIRVENDDVYNAMEGVLSTIIAALASAKR
jgi:very-short-patch-repair endonuclease